MRGHHEVGSEILASDVVQPVGNAECRDRNRPVGVAWRAGSLADREHDQGKGEFPADRGQCIPRLVKIITTRVV